MRHVLNFIFALVLAFGTGGSELRVESHREPCGCCETASPAEPCGCGMPQQSSSQRCGGSRAPSSVAIARPAAAPIEIRTAGQQAHREAKPFPSDFAAATPGVNREAEPLPTAAFPPGEAPPDAAAKRRSLLSVYRI